MLRSAILFLIPVLLPGQGPFLFTSFRGNGETGVYFALSRDGYKWTPVKNNQPVVPPQHPGMLMRDPFLVKGPDGTWHLLWTTGWTRSKENGTLTIGHATSGNLVDWGPQQLIEIPLEGARNAWAPEMAWDSKSGQWLIFWASTIPGKFPDTEATGDSGYNHRFYAMRTTDFKSFTKPALWFDPGFNCIDATLVQDGKRWIMVFKDERRNPLQKKLRIAFSDSPAGPWSGVTEPFSLDWVEGPSAIKAGRDWLIYFDQYAKPHYYGAYRTRDWKVYEEISSQLSLPLDHRHGTVVSLTDEEAKRVTALR